MLRVAHNPLNPIHPMSTLITKNFSWEEMQFSQTAQRIKIDNSIPAKYRENMERLCKEVLQPIRDAWGKPIVISSGYRCPKLNKAVGGAANSQHAFGSAADIHTVENTLTENKKLWDVIITLATAGKIKCRQIIWEYGKKGVGMKWIHLSVNDSEHARQENKQIFVGV